MADLSNIQHIVVLMLENRSFDNVLGFMRDASDGFDGLMGNTTANNDGVAPWTERSGVNSATLPDPDPGESFVDISQQVLNGGPTATTTGFRANYQKIGGSPDNIMHCFNRGELPALHQLADSFAVSDRWFASAPCQTWPNRFFAHTGTANGYETTTSRASRSR